MANNTEVENMSLSAHLGQGTVEKQSDDLELIYRTVLERYATSGLYALTDLEDAARAAGPDVVERIYREAHAAASMATKELEHLEGLEEAARDGLFEFGARLDLVEAEERAADTAAKLEKMAPSLGLTSEQVKGLPDVKALKALARKLDHQRLKAEAKRAGLPLKEYEVRRRVEKELARRLAADELLTQTEDAATAAQSS